MEKWLESQTHGLSISTIIPTERLYDNFYHFKDTEFQDRITQNALLSANGDFKNAVFLMLKQLIHPHDNFYWPSDLDILVVKTSC